MNLCISPVRNSEREILGTLIELSDMSNQKRAEEEHLALESRLRHTQKLESLGAMAGGFAHDDSYPVPR